MTALWKALRKTSRIAGYPFNREEDPIARVHPAASDELQNFTVKLALNVRPGAGTPTALSAST